MTTSWLQAPWVRALMALLSVLLLGCICNAGGAFFKSGTHLGVLGSVGVIGLLAVGQCLVILGGGIDLSVGSVLALANMAFAGLMLAAGWPWPAAGLAAVAAGGLCGAANGGLVVRFRIQPFLATLAVMVIARGLASFLPQFAGQPASSKFMPAGAELPASWQWIGGSPIAGLPTSGLLFLAAAAVVAFAVRARPFGHHLLAVGGNESAARLAGIDVARTRLCAFACCGALAGLAGICQAARDNLGNPDAGRMYELQAIAAVVIGGTSLQGGEGGIGLTVLGVLTIGYIEKVLSLNGIPDHWRLVIQGVIILLAVLFQDRRR